MLNFYNMSWNQREYLIKGAPSMMQAWQAQRFVRGICLVRWNILRHYWNSVRVLWGFFLIKNFVHKQRLTWILFFCNNYFRSRILMYQPYRFLYIFLIITFFITKYIMINDISVNVLIIFTRTSTLIPWDHLNL